MQLYIEGMCADEVDEWIFINGQKLLASGQEVRSTRSGCPQWEVPRVGTPAPEVQAAGVHRESSGAPTQAAWQRQAARRGDAEQPRRCAGRRAAARRRGEDSPLTGLADLRGVYVCVPGIEVLLQPPGSNGPLFRETSLASTQSQ